MEYTLEFSFNLKYKKMHITCKLLHLFIINYNRGPRQSFLETPVRDDMHLSISLISSQRVIQDQV